MGSSIDAYNAALSGVYDAADASTKQLSGKIQSKDYSKASDEELMGVCKEFEAYFVEQMFKALEKMVPEREDSSSASSYMNMFGDKLTGEYAKMATESGDGKGLGIAQMLYEQMKRNYNLE